MKNLTTYADLYEYIQTLEPLPATHLIDEDLQIALGVYAHKMQVNFIAVDKDMSIANMCFGKAHNEVALYKVDANRGVADYANPYTIPMDAAIADTGTDLIRGFGGFAGRCVRSSLEQLCKKINKDQPAEELPIVIPVNNTTDNNVKEERPMKKTHTHIYLITNPAELNPDAGLAGKLLRVYQKNPKDRVQFFDAVTMESIWRTTPATCEKTTIGGTAYLTITTQNSVYRLIQVNREMLATMMSIMIPQEDENAEAAAEQPAAEPEAPAVEETPAEPEVPALEVVHKKESHKPIHYGDGYDKIEFEFNREIDQGEFLDWLKANNYRLHDAQGWWDDHTKIEGSGKNWTYIWVRVYTD